MDENLSPEGTELMQVLRDPVGLIRRRWPWMLLALLLGIAATVAFVSRLPARYSASATVLVSSQQIPRDFVRTTVEEDTLERINAMMAAALSTDALLDLIGKYDPYPDLTASLDPDEIVNLLREDVSVQEERVGPRSRREETARLFRISFQANRPVVAAAMANEIATLFTAASTRLRSHQAHLTTEFLRQELTRAEQELREQQATITEFNERYRGELPRDLTANLGKLERLQQERQSLALQIAEAESRMAVISSSDEGLPGLRARLAEALAVHTDQHPDVVALKRQNQIFEGQMRGRDDADLDDSLFQAPQRTVGTLKQQLATTDAMIQELDARVAHTPARQEQLAVMEDNFGVLRETYLEFLRKVQDAELAETLESAQQGERIALVSRALPPRKPLKTRWKYAALGLAGSLAFALAAGAVLEMGNPVLTTTHQLEALGDFTILPSVPRIS